MPHALIVDDDSDTRDFLSQVAKGEGFTVAEAETLHAARAQLALRTPDVLLTDLQLPDGDGIALIKDLDRAAETEVVVVTGHASVGTAVEALRAGATDYLTKPIDVERLTSMLRRQPRTVDLKHEIGELRDELRKVGRFGHLYGSSPPMQALYDKIERVAPTSATVLLIGESGTGKELAAHTIHDLSKRKRAPFLAINCGAISPQQIDSELFGHEDAGFGRNGHDKGFFERARGGSLLLDEITEMSLALQVKLLRVLETGTFVRVGTSQPIAADVRIIAASKQPGKAVSDGKFREDLYHRLNVFPIHMPPLRERGGDLEMLAQHFLDELNATENSAKRFAQSVTASLYSHSWPGNVRELKNYVHRAYLLADAVIEDYAQSEASATEADHHDEITVKIGMPLDEIEERVTMATLARCGNVKKRAAAILGISLKTLYNRLESYSQREVSGVEGDAETV